MKVYFDNADNNPLYPEVVEKITEVLSNTYGNPSSTHALGRGAKSLIEYSRKQIAKELNALPSEIIFTSGGTEADNFILHSCVRDLGVQVVISSLIEHHAVLHTLEVLAKKYPIQIVYVNLTERGDIDLQHLKNLLEQYTEKKVLVSLMHLNNEIGNILPLKEVAILCKEKGAYFHSDTVQSVGHYPINLQEIPVDFITASAHKFHGPKGVGFAFIRKGVNVKSLLFGGEQERGRRAGTECIHNIVGMEEAFSLAYQYMDKERAYVEGIKKYFIQQITQEIPQVHFNGLSANLQESSYAIVNISFPIELKKTEVLMLFLDMRGIACSQGSACQSGSAQGSHVLRAILPEEQWPEAHIRFSFSIYNTKEEVDYVIETLKEFLA